jgi:hypothetical protein
MAMLNTFEINNDVLLERGKVRPYSEIEENIDWKIVRTAGTEPLGAWWMESGSGFAVSLVSSKNEIETSCPNMYNVSSMPELNVSHVSSRSV